MEESPDRVLIAGWIGSTNLGDELVLAGLRGKLAARGVEAVAVSVDPAATTREHGIAAVPVSGVPGAVGRADGVVLGGGGLLQDVTSPFNLPYHLGRVAVARARRRPYVGLGLGAGPIDTRLGRALTRRAMRGAVAVSVRDEASAAVLLGLGLPAPTVAADLALSLPQPEVEVRDEVVVALRHWDGARSRVPVGARRRRPAPQWFVAGMAAALDEVAAATGLRIHFVAFQRDRDPEIHERVAALMRAGGADVRLSAPGLADVVGLVAGGRVVVAMRYHAAVAAALGGRPAVLLGYSEKVPSLGSDLGAGAVTLAWAPDEVARLPRAVEAVIGAGDAMGESAARLRDRERGNDRVLDRLLTP